MINLNIGLNNPWAKSGFRNLWYQDGKFTKHKFWELEVQYLSSKVLEINVCYSVRKDHAGIALTFGLMGYCVHLQIYDNRHWDYENNCWNTYLGEDVEQ